MIRDIRFEPSQIYGSMQRPFWGFFAFSHDDSIQGPHVTRRTINQRNHAGSSISNRSDCLGKVVSKSSKPFSSSFANSGCARADHWSVQHGVGGHPICAPYETSSAKPAPAF